MDLSVKDLQMLGWLERRMDSDEQPWVMTPSGRLAVNHDVMNELELTTGQSVCDVLVAAILQANHASLLAEMAMNKLAPPVEVNGVMARWRTNADPTSKNHNDVVGEPQATPHFSVDDLKGMGLVGLYEPVSEEC